MLQELQKRDNDFNFDPYIHMNLSHTDKKNLDQLQKYRKIQWFTQVQALQTGHSFGELALINNEPRKATIKCLTVCYFAYLSRDHYRKIIKKVQIREQIEKIDFLKSIPFFGNQTQNQLKKLILSFKQQSVCIHQYVIRQGQTSSFVYIVKEGEF